MEASETQQILGAWTADLFSEMDSWDSRLHSLETSIKNLETGQLPSNIIGSDQLGANSVGPSQLQDASIEESALIDAIVSNAKLQDASVDNDKIVDLSIVGEDKIVPGTITGDLIPDGAIEYRHLSIDSISGDEILPEAIVGGTHIQAESIIAENIQAGVITANEISVGIGDDLIGNGRFEDDVSSWKIVDGSGTFTQATVADPASGDHMGRLSSGAAISVGAKAVPVSPGQTYGVKLALRHSDGNESYSIFMNEIADEPSDEYVDTSERTSTTVLQTGANSTITSLTRLEFVYTVPAGVYWASLCIAQGNSTGTLDIDDVEMRRQDTAVNIKDGIITAPKINVSQLSAISADAGLITAGIFRGPLFETSELFPKVQLTEEGFFALDSDGNATFSADALTGAITARGHFTFGNSRLNPDDTIDMFIQPSGGYQEPKIVQKRQASARTIFRTINFNSPTIPGNQALLIVHTRDALAVTPSGWTAISSTFQNGVNTVIYRRDSSTSFQGLGIAFTAECDSVVQMFEVSGILTGVRDAAGSAQGNGTAVSVSTSAATTQTHELVLLSLTAGDDDSSFTDPTGFTQQGEGSYNTILGAWYTKNITTTGVQSASSTLNPSGNWGATIITFKAKAAVGNPEVPGANTLRLFTKLEDGEPKPYVIEPNNTILGLARSIGDVPLKVSGGTGSGVVTSGTNNVTVTVNHLGPEAPAVVVAGSRTTNFNAKVTGITGTTISISLRQEANANVGSNTDVDFHWIALWAD